MKLSALHFSELYDIPQNVKFFGFPIKKLTKEILK